MLWQVGQVKYPFVKLRVFSVCRRGIFRRFECIRNSRSGAVVLPGVFVDAPESPLADDSREAHACRVAGRSARTRRMSSLVAWGSVRRTMGT